MVAPGALPVGRAGQVYAGRLITQRACEYKYHAETFGTMKPPCPKQLAGQFPQERKNDGHVKDAGGRLRGAEAGDCHAIQPRTAGPTRPMSQRTASHSVRPDIRYLGRWEVHCHNPTAASPTRRPQDDRHGEGLRRRDSGVSDMPAPRVPMPHEHRPGHRPEQERRGLIGRG